MNDAQPIAPTGEPEAGEHFRAFMSYSHADAAAARRLHRRLETYRLPRRLEPTAAEEGSPRRLGRIFRDREDLPAASDLSESVQRAMTVSEALIVLCSPEAKASPWVGKEIALFRRLHPDRPILAALIRGAPAQAFPVELTEGTEPLAADLRPEGDGRRLGFLKIVAGLAGVPLDALVQRDAQRRVRRITWVTLAALIAMVAMAAMTIVTLDAYRRAERARAAEA
ncbi:MAG: toll/interleukin-1 receptor domain-containing protein, partial [Sphingomonadaceae bacterium]|nr:toll/interleukin-1 receptor domain-containing protein [Sphingomonadaceae bacterium]